MEEPKFALWYREREHFHCPDNPHAVPAGRDNLSSDTWHRDSSRMLRRGHDAIKLRHRFGRKSLLQQNALRFWIQLDDIFFSRSHMATRLTWGLCID